MRAPSARHRIAARPGHVVVITHGFMAHRWLLMPLARRLTRLGWQTRVWGYQSLTPSVMTHGERLARLLAQLQDQADVDHIHVVAHSMGGIVTRAALTRGIPTKFGRLVMLAPPNRGSFVATATAGLMGSVLRPVAELTTHPESLVNRLPEPQGVEIGVIAAGRDQLVSLDSTRLSMPHHHAVLPCMHSSLLFRRDAAALTAQFLETGSLVAARSSASIPTPTHAP
ncbi:MAG: esterase/lipase family protein [Pirellulales bacterium]|jgi:pimeloyl-ACP methyl ester carboxylesterase